MNLGQKINLYAAGMTLNLNRHDADTIKEVSFMDWFLPLFFSSVSSSSILKLSLE